MSRSIVRCFLCKLDSYESQNKESKKKRERVLSAFYNLSSLFSLLFSPTPKPRLTGFLFCPHSCLPSLGYLGTLPSLQQLLHPFTSSSSHHPSPKRQPALTLDVDNSVNIKYLRECLTSVRPLNHHPPPVTAYLPT